jgi:hypothetical protein
MLLSGLKADTARLYLFLFAQLAARDESELPKQRHPPQAKILTARFQAGLFCRIRATSVGRVFLQKSHVPLR